MVKCKDCVVGAVFSCALGLISASTALAATYTLPGQSTTLLHSFSAALPAFDANIAGDATVTIHGATGGWTHNFFGPGATFVSIDGIGGLQLGFMPTPTCSAPTDVTFTIPQANLINLAAGGPTQLNFQNHAGAENCAGSTLSYTGITISYPANAISNPSNEPSTAQVAEAATQQHLSQSSAALLGMQPGLTHRVGDAETASSNIQVTQGIGFARFDSNSGPVWAAFQAERQETTGGDGVFALASLGMQWDTGPRSATGVLLQFDTGRTEPSGGAETSSRGFLAGVYTVQQLGWLTFDGRLLAGRSVTDVTSGANSASGVEGNRVLATAQLSGTHAFANGQSLRLRASTQFVRQENEAYVIGGTTVAAQSQTLGEAVLGGDWSLPVGDSSNLTFGAEAQNAFNQSGGTVVPNAVRGRMAMGWSHQSLSGGPNVAVQVYVDGLGQSGYDARGGSFNINWDF